MFFQFESDFVDSLRCIPMSVRYKLDTCGVKLKLPHWNHMTQEERSLLVTTPCTTEAEIETYRSLLHQLVKNQGSDRPSDLPIEPHPDWMNETQIPESVKAKAAEVGYAIGLEQWKTLDPIQRFVLIKLSRSNHENKNFLPALQEFGLSNEHPLQQT